MNEIIFEIVKLVVMVAALVIARYLVPFVKNKIGASKLELIAQWAKYAVLKAQQVLWSESGEDKKAYVTEFLKKLLIEKNISISDEQLDILIEAAVKQMKKIQELQSRRRTQYRQTIKVPQNRRQSWLLQETA